MKSGILRRMLPNVLTPSPIYHSSAFKNLPETHQPPPSIGGYFMENLLRVNSLNSGGGDHGYNLIPSSSAFKSELEMSSNNMKDKGSRSNSLLFLGPSSSSHSSGIFS